MEDQQPSPGDLTDESPDDDSATAADKPAKRRRRRRPALTAGVLAAALFVGSAAFAGAAVQPYLADRAEVEAKLQLVRTAKNAVDALWNYTPETMESLPSRASKYLSGDLEADYRKFIEAISSVNKQAKVTDSTEITGAAVESLDGREATVIVYTNTTATSELKRSIPSLKYQSHVISMRRDHDRWVITRMPTITSLNLTPQI